MMAVADNSMGSTGKGREKWRKRSLDRILQSISMEPVTQLQGNQLLVVYLISKPSLF